MEQVYENSDFQRQSYWRFSALKCALACVFSSRDIADIQITILKIHRYELYSSLTSRQGVLNFCDWRTPNSFPVEAQNPMQIVQICWKGTCFSKLSWAKHVQEDCRPLILLTNAWKPQEVVVLMQGSEYFLPLTWFY